jgi:molecular chaperone GrpE
MGRAIAAIPAEARAGTDAALSALIEGAELTEREMLRALEKHGIKRLDPKGERFDPNFHQAIFEVPDPAVPTGTVAQVVQVGYSIGDRVLRPAMVGVARGGPKPSAAEAGATIDKTA